MNTDISKKVELFFSQFQLHSFKKGQLIIQPDESVRQSYFLKQGYVREYGVSQSGIEITIHIFIPFSFFPMTSIIANIKNRYYFETLTDTQIYIGPKKKVFLFLEKNPDVLMDVTSRILHGLDKLSARIESIMYNKASQKVASVLLYLAKHFGQIKLDKTTIQYRFTHKDIALLAGLSRETASREWEKLEKGGFIYYKNNLIVINDESRLKEKLTIK